MGSDGVTGRASSRASWWVRSTSPLHCVVVFLAGAGLQRGLDLPALHGCFLQIAQVAGTVLANGGLLLVLWSFVLFAIHRTTVWPGGMPVRLLRQGPFRWSRNPVYLGMLASYVGLALMCNLPWALLLLPVPVWILQRAIIPFEEGSLRAAFGADYADYSRSVRRWL